MEDEEVKENEVLERYPQFHSILWLFSSLSVFLTLFFDLLTYLGSDFESSLVLPFLFFRWVI